MKYSENELAYWLYQLPGIGVKSQDNLYSQFQSAQNIYRATERELGELLTQKQLTTLLRSRNSWQVQEEYMKLEKQHIHFYGRRHPGFPDRLRHIPDPPGGLFVKGGLPVENQVSVAVIGARMCSEYGRYMARQFGMQLARAGIQVISGLANGVDGISQKAALEAGGTSYGVLGCGADICYPAENRALYDQLPLQGGILSEYLPGTQPKAALFPPRNRIISGLSDCILVIEAKERSGTLITVDMALEQGKDVYALPGRVTDALSRGCNKLLKQGAGIVVSPQDFLDEISRNLGSGMQVERNQQGMEQKDNVVHTLTEKEKESELSEQERAVYLALDFNPKSLDQLLQETGQFTLPQIMTILCKLCMLQYARQVSSSQFLRTR